MATAPDAAPDRSAADARPDSAAPGADASIDAPVASGSPTRGWTSVSWNADSFYVQNRTSAPLEQRYTFENGVYTTQVVAGEERVEMRWDDWPDQRKEHMWEGEIMIESGSNRTAVMQIKSNEDGEPIYLQVFNTNGDIRNNGDPDALATAMYGKWFNWKAAFNPVTGLGRAWINDVLVKTRQYRTPTAGWYFKNGTYNNGMPAGGRSIAHFRNIKLWRNDGGGS
jgi:hypothetical protein